MCFILILTSNSIQQISNKPLKLNTLTLNTTVDYENLPINELLALKTSKAWDIWMA